MAVRNCKEIGANLKLIMKRLMANNELVNLLYYTDRDPLNQPYLDETTKQTEIFEKLMKIVPIVTETEMSKSTIAITVISGLEDSSNDEFKTVTIRIETFIPLSQAFGGCSTDNRHTQYRKNNISKDSFHSLHRYNYQTLIR